MGSVRYSKPDYKNQAHLAEALGKSVPLFDKKTEDGTRFRIYKLGSLEVRTTQEQDGIEIVGVVYTVQMGNVNDLRTFDSARVVKVTEYVEQASLGRRYYVVLETE